MTPADRRTIADIAKHWHFSNAGRMAAEYRAAFGTAPSAALRSFNPEDPDPRATSDLAGSPGEGSRFRIVLDCEVEVDDADATFASALRRAQGDDRPWHGYDPTAARPTSSRSCWRAPSVGSPETLRHPAACGQPDAAGARRARRVPVGRAPAVVGTRPPRTGRPFAVTTTPHCAAPRCSPPSSPQDSHSPAARAPTAARADGFDVTGFQPENADTALVDANAAGDGRGRRRRAAARPHGHEGHRPLALCRGPAQPATPTGSPRSCSSATTPKPTATSASRSRAVLDLAREPRPRRPRHSPPTWPRAAGTRS